MPVNKDALGKGDRGVAGIARRLARRLQLRGAGVNAHAEFDGGRRPCLYLQRSLTVQRRAQCVARIVKCHRVGIPDDLKGKPIVCGDGLIQNFVVPRQQAGHGIGVLLSEFGAALDVSKEERDGAGRGGVHPGLCDIRVQCLALV